MRHRPEQCINLLHPKKTNRSFTHIASYQLMKKQLLTTFFISASIAGAMAQNTNVPRLVVGITIDQLRTDYLNAFMPLYGEGGFKLLLEKGKV